MSAQITLNWTKDSTFETLLDGHKVTIDTTAENGGNNEGPRPKALMLVALAGCSAMDVISLFLKMRVRFDKISIDVTAETSSAERTSWRLWRRNRTGNPAYYQRDQEPFLP